MEHGPAFPIVILTGLSGAGKSTALRVFEDMGFFCVDGLPVGMVPKLASLYKGQDHRNTRGLALGMDIRQHDFLDDWNAAADEITSQGLRTQIVFLEAETGELLRRYHETRRPHPLEQEDMGLEQALAEERRILSPLRSQASLVIDTTTYSIHDLRRALQEKWANLAENGQGMRVHVISFGFKYASPKEADLMFDLRFLPNPFFDERLKPLTGRDRDVADYVLQSPQGQSFSVKLLDFLQYLVPLYAQEGRYRLTIALGCTGGRHRSVATAEMVSKELKRAGYAVTLEHRHVDR
ncbi:RNase adapter RapZ [Desulfohalovibrio reitneri]|uniref:RNase adapter RapZ n=1 Tax=Desulfohalovibrio reitneri TaxID=1307759 RepID=UPI0004A6EF18|nr:RNase adapter RapZ [Desulfohalovibrio reitneri]